MSEIGDTWKAIHTQRYGTAEERASREDVAGSEAQGLTHSAFRFRVLDCGAHIQLLTKGGVPKCLVQWWPGRGKTTWARFRGVHRPGRRFGDLTAIIAEAEYRYLFGAEPEHSVCECGLRYTGSLSEGACPMCRAGMEGGS